MFICCVIYHYMAKKKITVQACRPQEGGCIKEIAGDKMFNVKVFKEGKRKDVDVLGC